MGVHGRGWIVHSVGIGYGARKIGGVQIGGSIRYSAKGT